MSQGKLGYGFARHAWSNTLILDGYVAIASDASIIAAATSFTPDGPLPTVGTSRIPQNVASIAKGTTGQYVITLSDKFRQMLSATANIAFDNTLAALDVAVLGDNVNPTVAKGSQKVILQIVNSATGAAADPAAPCGIYFQIKLQGR